MRRTPALAGVAGRRSAVLVAREVRTRLRTSSWRVTTVLLVIAAVAGVVLPEVFGGDDDDAVTVAVGPQVPAAVTETVGRLRVGDPAVPVELTRTDQPAAATGLVDRGETDVGITTDQITTSGDAGNATDVAETRVVATAAELLRLAGGARAAGLSESQTTELLSAQGPAVTTIEDDGDTVEDDDQFALAYGGALVLYLLLIFYGQAVTTGVNEEKSSRVIEVLLATTPPRALLWSKIAGIGLVGLLQLLIVGAAVTLAALRAGSSLPTGSVTTAASLTAWFVLGYALYCTVFAVAGVLTSRTEEAQQAATPVFVLLGVGYLIALFGSSAPDGTASVIGSMVPFTAPIVMPVRAAVGDVATWELATAIVATLVTTALLARLAARIYTSAALRFGARVPLLGALGNRG